MINIVVIEVKDRGAIKITNDKTYGEVTIMFEDEFQSEYVLIRIIKEVLKNED